jgi:tRNA (cmo5U34)-methyltransferase
VLELKASIDQIRARFDKDVERFSNLETGQSSTVDAPLVMELIARCVRASHPKGRSLLDLGCGAGNFSLRLRQELPQLQVTLVDLSRPMLNRAVERLGAGCRALQGDLRTTEWGSGYHIVVATAVLHHLRTDDEWSFVFSKIHACLAPGGTLWVADLVCHELPEVQEVMWDRYGEYLEALKGREYRDHVFDYVEFEDTPKPLTFQLEQVRLAGFTAIDVLHKNSCFAAYCARK